MNIRVILLYILIINASLVFMPSKSMNDPFATSSLDEPQSPNPDLMDILSQSAITSSGFDRLQQPQHASQLSTPITSNIQQKPTSTERLSMEHPEYWTFYDNMDTYAKTKNDVFSTTSDEALAKARSALNTIKSLNNISNIYTQNFDDAYPDEELITEIKKIANSTYFAYFPADLHKAISWFMSNFNKEDKESKENTLLILQYAADTQQIQQNKIAIKNVIHAIQNSKSNDEIRQHTKSIEKIFRPRQAGTNQPKAVLPIPSLKIIQPPLELIDHWSQSALHHEPTTTKPPMIWEPLAKPSYLKFYTLVNEYLLKKDQSSLAQAKKILPNIFDTPVVAAMQVYSIFINNVSPTQEMIDAVKKALNGYHFHRHRDDLCKSVPFFLEAIVANDNDNTKNDILRILDLLFVDKQDDKNAQETISSVKADIQALGVDQESISRYLNSLDEICKFFPEKNFIKASTELTEHQLMGLLNTKEIKRDETVRAINKNIDAMMNFIKMKSSPDQTRLKALNTIKEQITHNKVYTNDLVKNLIQNVAYVTEETLRPSMEGSTFGMQRREQEQAAYEQAQKEAQEKSRKEQEAIKQLVLDNYTVLLTRPTEIIDYINSQQDWDIQTKISFLQLLFWHAHVKEQEITEKAGLERRNRSQAVNKVLRDFMKALRDYETNKNLKEILKNYRQSLPEYTKATDEEKQILLDSPPSLARISHDEDGLPMPYFTFPFDTLPTDTPPSLKTLFNQYQQTKSASTINQPTLAIQRLYNGITTLQKILTNDLKITLPSDEIIDQLKKDKEETSKPKKEQLGIKSPKNANIDTTIATLVEKASTSEKQQERIASLNEKQQKYYATRSKKIAQLADPEKLKQQIAERITKKQEKMEELISAEITKLEKSLPKNKNQSSLSTIKTQLQDFQRYVSDTNTLLKKRVQRALNIIMKNQIAPEKTDAIKNMDNLIADLTKEIDALQQSSKPEIIIAQPAQQPEAIPAEPLAETPVTAEAMQPPTKTIPAPVSEPASALSQSKSPTTRKEPQEKGWTISTSAQKLERLKTFLSNPDLTNLSWPNIAAYDSVLYDIQHDENVTADEKVELEKKIQNLKLQLSIKDLKTAADKCIATPNSECFKNVIAYIYTLSQHITPIDEQNKTVITELWNTKVNKLMLKIVEWAKKDKQSPKAKDLLNLVEACLILQKNIPALSLELDELKSIIDAPILKHLIDTWKTNPNSVNISSETLKNSQNMLENCIGYDTISEKEAELIKATLAKMNIVQNIKEFGDAIKKYRNFSDENNINNIIYYIRRTANDITEYSPTDIQEIAKLGEDLKTEYQPNEHTNDQTTITNAINSYLNFNPPGVTDTNLHYVITTRRNLAQQVRENCEQIRKYVSDFPLLGKQSQGLPELPVIIIKDTKPLSTIIGGTPPSSPTSAQLSDEAPVPPQIVQNKPPAMPTKRTEDPNLELQLPSYIPKSPEEPVKGVASALVSNFTNGIKFVINSFIKIITWPFTFISSRFGGS